MSCLVASHLERCQLLIANIVGQPPYQPCQAVGVQSEGSHTTMVSVSTVQPSLNQEFLCTYKTFNMSLYTFNEKTQSRGIFYIKSNELKYISMVKICRPAASL